MEMDTAEEDPNSSIPMILASEITTAEGKEQAGMSQLAMLSHLLMDPASILPAMSSPPWEQQGKKVQEDSVQGKAEVQDMDIKISNRGLSRDEHNTNTSLDGGAKRAMAAGAGRAYCTSHGTSQDGRRLQRFCLCNLNLSTSTDPGPV